MTGGQFVGGVVVWILFLLLFSVLAMLSYVTWGIVGLFTYAGVLVVPLSGRLAFLAVTDRGHWK